MRLPALVFAALFAPSAVIASAQSHPDCPTRPTTLKAMRSCYRPLLVFAPSATDPRLAQQQAILDQDADDMMDRNVLLVPLPFPPSASVQPALPLDAPYALLPASQAAATRNHYHVPAGRLPCDPARRGRRREVPRHPPGPG